MVFLVLLHVPGIITVLCGQSLVSTGKLWSALHSYSNPMVFFTDYTKFEGDTTIGGLAYMKVWRALDEAHQIWNPNGFIREEGDGKVFYLSWWGGPPNNLVYDFNAVAGDTISLFYDPMGTFFTISSVDSVTLLTGEKRKQINLVCRDAGGNIYGEDHWIEGIGSLFGVLQSGSCLLVGDSPQLLCYHENEVLEYQNPGYDKCFVITGIAPRLPVVVKVELFPNPASDRVNVQINDPSMLPGKLVFRDPTGRIILDRLTRDPSTVIDLGCFHAPPVILYSVTAADGTVVSGKLITCP